MIWGPAVAHLPFFLFGFGIGALGIVRPAWWVRLLAAFVFVGYLALVAGDLSFANGTLTSLLLVNFAWMAWLGVDMGWDHPVLGFYATLAKPRW